MPAFTKVDTEPLLTHPTGRKPPERVVRELRKIDPNVELVYFGEGRWLLGSVSPHSERQARGEAMLKSVRMVSVGDQSKRALHRRWLALLFAQGFRTIQMYEYEEGSGGPDQRIIDDFRTRDRNWRVALDGHLEETERQIDGRAAEEEATATLLEAARAKAGDVTKFAFRKARSLIFDGSQIMGVEDGNQHGPAVLGEDAPDAEEIAENRLTEEEPDPNQHGPAVGGTDTEEDDG